MRRSPQRSVITPAAAVNEAEPNISAVNANPSWAFEGAVRHSSHATALQPARQTLRSAPRRPARAAAPPEGQSFSDFHHIFALGDRSTEGRLRGTDKGSGLFHAASIRGAEVHCC